MSVQWKELLQEEFSKEYFLNLKNKVRNAYQTSVVYPAQSDIFKAFKYTPYTETKVVILGQDVYHGPGQATGLAFGVNNTIPIPPSLANIFKEIGNEYGDKPKNSELTGWAKQGVLLLNSILTVEKYNPTSHQYFGWEIFTDSVISKLNDRTQPIAFLLWGSYAINKAKLIDSKKHLVLKAVHPSPLSAYRGFFGCNHFIKVNEWLEQKNILPINWLES